MRVCTRNSDGRIIEAQSGADQDLAVLIQNAVNAGYQPGDVTASVMDDAAFASLMAKQDAADAALRRAQSVSMLSARRALRAAGLLDQVNALVLQQPPDVQDAWQYAQSLSRTSPTLLGLAKVLNLSDQQLDSLFKAADQLSTM